MSLAFWLLATVALLLALLQLGVALRVAGAFGGTPAAGAPSGAAPGPRPPLSVLVPLKGARPGLEERLRRLLTAMRPDDQLLLAMETADDPAHAVAEALRLAHPDRGVAVVLSGPPGERMGKQHNLCAALPEAQHELLAFMDDDVLIEAAHLDEGAALASMPRAGAAFAVPYYAGEGPLGGGLVAAYTNHGFSPNMASLALQSPPRFIIGGFWVGHRHGLEAIGGLEPFTRTVSDDAAIGRAFAAAGLRNRALHLPLRLPHEQLGLVDGLRQLLKWLTMLRAEGLGLLALIFLTWHPLAVGVLAGLVGWAAPGVPAGWALAVVASVLLLRVAAVLVLSGKVYRLRPPTRYLAVQLVYEVLVAPWLFLLAAFRRELRWRGRLYRIGAGGRIE